MRAAEFNGDKLRAALREVRIVFYYHFFLKTFVLSSLFPRN